VTDDEIDDRIDEWHTMDDAEYIALGEPALHEYMGWTWEEYVRWVESW
jgi:hypothetical protein